MRPSSLDLATVNAAQKVAVNALKAYVCELEQNDLDASRRRDYQTAKLQSDWAVATDLCVYKVSGALSELFMEALNAPPLHSHSTVQLPSLERSTEDVEPVERATVRLLRPESPEPEPPAA